MSRDLTHRLHQLFALEPRLLVHTCLKCREHPAATKPTRWTLADTLNAIPQTLAGAVRVFGTRLSVDFILELFQNGWTESEVRENYPQITPEVLADVFAFARQSLHSEQIITLGS